MMTLEERERRRLEREKKAEAKSEIIGMSKSDMNFEAKFTMDEEGMRGLAKFLKELDDEIVDDIFSGKQGLNIRDSKRGEVELSRVVRCKDCKWFTAVNEACGKCTYRTRAFLYNENDDYCSYGERKEHSNEHTD